MTNTYPPPYKFKFTAGPYIPPVVKKGDMVQDEWLGAVTVDGWMDAPIRWPATTHRSKLVPILFDGLVRAVVEETESAVSYYWSVSKYHIDRWKKALAQAETASEVHTKLVLLRREPAFRQKYGYPP
jgi:hypothetical protein